MKGNKIVIILGCILLSMFSAQNVLAKKRVENLVSSWDNEWNDAPIEGASADLGFICEWEKYDGL